MPYPAAEVPLEPEPAIEIEPDLELELESERAPGADEIEIEIEIEIDVELEPVVTTDPVRAVGTAVEPASTSSAVVTRKKEEGPADALLGQLIEGRYRVDARLARGGMGSVYRGENVHLRKAVAIKVLRPETQGFPELVARFRREAVAGAMIEHPNVASALDFGRLADASYFLVTELVRGVTLRQRISGGPMAPAEAVRIARQLAAALGACHKHGILHRDVKPRNIMLAEDRGEGELVKLIDFGLAKLPPPERVPRDGRGDARSDRDRGEGDVDGQNDEDEPATLGAMTLHGVVFGTVAYMAPEAALGMDAVDQRSDLYALGIVLYEMLVGKHPYDAKEASELFRCQRFVPPPPFAARAPGLAVPPAFEAVVMRLLEKDPGRRYPDAAATLTALDEVADRQAFAVSAASIPSAPIDGRGPWKGAPPPTSPSSLSPTTTSTAPPGPARSATPGRRRLALASLALLAAAGLVAGLATTGYGRALGPRWGRSVAQPGLLVVTRSASDAADRARHRIAAARPSGAADPASASLRKRLRDAAEAQEWATGARALLSLAALDGPHLDPPDIAPAARVAQWIEFRGDPWARGVFAALAGGLGTGGIDALYEVARQRGGSAAARRAEAVLATPEVRVRATPALRAALLLREARCESKALLFEQASRDGDARALELLERLRSLRCGASRCCYLGNPALDAAIRGLRDRPKP